MLQPIYRGFGRLSETWRFLGAGRIRFPAFGDVTGFCTDYSSALGQHGTRALDLGCGHVPKNPFRASALCGVDIREHTLENVKKADLALERIPYEDSAFDYITAFDFLEHVPRLIYTPELRLPFVEVMNEIYRVLKPGGVFLSQTPAYPRAEAFSDPTHVNIITEDTFRCYFDAQKRWASTYGFQGAFVLVKQGWCGPHLVSVLKKSAAESL